MTQRGLSRFTTPRRGRAGATAGEQAGDVTGTRSPPTGSLRSPAPADSPPTGSLRSPAPADSPPTGSLRSPAPADSPPTGSLRSPAPAVPAALARFIGSRTPPTPGEACELCAEPVPDEHRHVVDLERRSLLCSCRACALLFESDRATARVSAATHPHAGRYRTVPDRYLRIDPVTLPAQAWATLQIPVGIVFVVANSPLERTVAFYPSPAGATESELQLDAWDQIVAANPALAQVEPDVEAVLIRTDTDEPQCHVVPVDRCYELVGALRLHWRGFDGGTEVRERIAAFFADVAGRCASVDGPASDRSPAHPPRSSAAPSTLTSAFPRSERGDGVGRLGGGQA